MAAVIFAASGAGRAMIDSSDHRRTLSSCPTSGAGRAVTEAFPAAAHLVSDNRSPNDRRA
ncbi:hypothetical protein [Micromonospora sp. NPDC005203]|uniref:hypothetical protein n=1 Tax=Micromonospora sp. NPDC005203 TaxID=3364226 RepID=UPI0036847359